MHAFPWILCLTFPIRPFASLFDPFLSDRVTINFPLKGIRRGPPLSAITWLLLVYLERRI